MNKINLVLFILTSVFAFSQQKKLPEGWDQILLDGKVAYMNLITGDVSTKFPKNAAKKPEKVVEYDPTITHVVKKGETLSSIARTYNMNLAQLYRLNSMVNFDAIEVGDEVVIGYEENPNEKEAIETVESSVNSNKDLHIVTSGETLFSISKRYKVSVAYLKEVNGLKSNAIFTGQKLRIH
ncbi:LysM peptidoglycan-binding domain-containing protein [Tenacibaculum agarivorans]|uniref:LysM peptidoglycan-binding domain-containing protein n=1 Tax=Tenacibaculum agarivorans TaxID=1908389 RepID=UPI00094B7A05|nr:LysM peptidoglycan-binding domain-containing protein [Tenacibaculum agarivorans]